MFSAKLNGTYSTWICECMYSCLLSLLLFLLLFSSGKCELLYWCIAHTHAPWSNFQPAERLNEGHEPSRKRKRESAVKWKERERKRKLWNYGGQIVCAAYSICSVLHGIHLYLFHSLFESCTFFFTPFRLFRVWFIHRILWCSVSRVCICVYKFYMILGRRTPHHT